MNAIKKHFVKYNVYNKQFEHFIEKVPLKKLINNSEEQRNIIFMKTIM